MRRTPVELLASEVLGDQLLHLRDPGAPCGWGMEGHERKRPGRIHALY